MKILANMTYAQLVAMITENLEGNLVSALEFTNKIAPWLDPVKDHSAKVKIDGCSRFSDVCTAQDSIALALKSKLIEVRRGRDEGHGKAIILIFEAPEIIGETAESVPIDGEEYEMRKIHGCLQPSGTVSYWPMSTRIFSIVITIETDDGDCAFASAHPGLPDPDPRPGWIDLKEGEQLSAFQVLLYRLRPTSRRS